MKITKKVLKKIIQEETTGLLGEMRRLDAVEANIEKLDDEKAYKSLQILRGSDRSGDIPIMITLLKLKLGLTPEQGELDDLRLARRNFDNYQRFLARTGYKPKPKGGSGSAVFETYAPESQGSPNLEEGMEALDYLASLPPEQVEAIVSYIVKMLGVGGAAVGSIVAADAMTDEKEVKDDPQYYDEDHLDEAIALAVFEAKKKIDKERMKCDSPRYLRKGEPGYGDKQKVVKACDGDKQKLIKFGDANLENKSDDPDSKKNFRARHNCEEKDDEMTAGYWACKDW